MNVRFFHHLQRLVELKIEEAKAGHTQFKQVVARCFAGFRGWGRRYGGPGDADQGYAAPGIFKKRSSGSHQSGRVKSWRSLPVKTFMTFFLLTSLLARLRGAHPIFDSKNGGFMVIFLRLVKTN